MGGNGRSLSLLEGGGVFVTLCAGYVAGSASCVVVLFGKEGSRIDGM